MILKKLLFFLAFLVACDSAPRQPRLGTNPQPVDTCKTHHHHDGRNK